jgi:hypothetical protein
MACEWLSLFHENTIIGFHVPHVQFMYQYSCLLCILLTPLVEEIGDDGTIVFAIETLF